MLSPVYRMPLSIIALLLGYMCMSCNEPGKSIVHYEPVYAKDTIPGRILFFGCPSLAYYEKFTGICQYLNKRLSGNIQIQPVAANTLLEYAEAFSKKKFDIGMTNGELSVKDYHGVYTIVAKFANDDDYRGLVLTRKDVQVKTAQDLRGKTITCPGPDALAGTKMPLYYLATQGLDLNKDIRIVQLASFESVFMSVYLGKSDAGTTWLSAWNSFSRSNPRIASALTPRFVTASLPNVAMLMRSDIPPDIQTKILNLVLDMNKNPEGQKLLSAIGATGFKKANANSYKEILVFVEKYQKIAPASAK